MKAASGTLLVVVALCAMMTAGCQKQLELTFVNHTNSVVPVRVSTPQTGTMEAGSLGPSGSKLHCTIRIEMEDLPALCTCTVGVGFKTFTVTKDTKGKLWFHYTKEGLAGPTDKEGSLVGGTQEGEIKPPAPAGTVVE
ncbi:MAG: hypothetical protein AMJ81_13470 [Phycisphaerae bacterium SM23_33]|jgi:hypothetical protein|nr:MAG: hypothetical protein AMJ81_13470 [Phycisphaerae bacterium SM23_33]